MRGVGGNGATHKKGECVRVEPSVRMVVHSAHVKSDAPARGDESRYGSIPEINREMAIGDSTLRCRGRAAIHVLVGVLGAATLLTALVAVALIQAGGNDGVVTQTSALLQVGVLVCIPLPPLRSLSFSVALIHSRSICRCLFPDDEGTCHKRER